MVNCCQNSAIQVFCLYRYVHVIKLLSNNHECQKN